MGKFDGILICTDLDGTILKNDKTISPENLNAIEYFKSEGGYFTFITGRMPYYAIDMYNLIKPNAPIGCVNGGGVYDYNEQKYIWTSTMPSGVNKLIEMIDRELPSVGINVSTFYKTYFAKDNAAMQRFRAAAKLPNLVKHYTEVDEPIGKIIFATNIEEEIQAVHKMLLSHPDADKFDFIRSERSLFEILPKGISKGIAIKKLAEYLNIDISKTVAIGDYDNDISMFSAAGIGIAVSNACENAIRAADYVTVSNEEHAIAKVISDIENGFYRV